MLWKQLDIRTVTAKEYADAAAALDPVKQARLAKTRQRKERLRTVAADMLVRRMLSEALGESPEELRFCYTENGKPGLEGDTFFFSIGRSEDFVVAAISPFPIGIDLEKIRDIDPVCARKYFTPSEIAHIFGHEPGEQEWKNRAAEPGVRMRYFEIYTAKQAYIKCHDSDLAHCKQVDTTHMDLVHHLNAEDYVISIYEEKQE